jgi:hypothetical protein
MTDGGSAAGGALHPTPKRLGVRKATRTRERRQESRPDCNRGLGGGRNLVLDFSLSFGCRMGAPSVCPSSHHQAHQSADLLGPCRIAWRSLSETSTNGALNHRSRSSDLESQSRRSTQPQSHVRSVCQMRPSTTLFRIADRTGTQHSHRDLPCAYRSCCSRSLAGSVNRETTPKPGEMTLSSSGSRSSDRQLSAPDRHRSRWIAGHKRSWRFARSFSRDSRRHYYLRRITDRASAATDSAERQRHATESRRQNATEFANAMVRDGKDWHQMSI